MTYGVPYSFVPGTKAKADEVNANFIDVLNKIEDTNTRIDNTNSQIESDITTLNTNLTSQIASVSNSRANLDLSNLSNTGKAVLSAKADVSIVDGAWTYKNTVICTDKSITPNNTQNFSLSSYLPNDSNKYEIIFSLAINVANNSNHAYLYSKTDFLKTGLPIFRKGNCSNLFGGNIVSAVVSTGRSISIISTTASSGSTTYTLTVSGYRKVR